MNVPDSLRREVVKRAVNRCEYCGLSQEGQEAAFHVDHIMPVVLGGLTEASNLALACVSCSLRKGARVTATDHVTGENAALFHPRRHVWNEHLRWSGATLQGITAVGRATVAALAINRPITVRIRQEQTLWGRHPPPGQL